MIVYSVRARRDLERIRAHIEAESLSAATRVLLRIHKRIGDLQDMPLQGRAGPRAGTRELVILQAPFIVTYRIVKDSITILAIRHTSRRPPG